MTISERKECDAREEIVWRRGYSFGRVVGFVFGVLVSAGILGVVCYFF